MRSRSLPGTTLIHSQAISSTPEALDPVVEKVVRLLGERGYMEGHRVAIELALREALANAILHGNGSSPKKRVRLDCYEKRDQSVLLVVRDEGRGFDPRKVGDPTRPENIYRAGGRGIFLIRHFMDEVRFRLGGREIRMRKDRPQAG